jgi:hypothetical protein
LGFDQHWLDLRLKDPATNRHYDEHYLIGLVAAQVENFQGHHLAATPDLPRVLFVFDECSAFSDAFYDAATSQAQRFLALGNPLNTTNFFYRRCKAGDEADVSMPDRLMRHVIHIDAKDSPNVEMGLKWRRDRRPGMPPSMVPGVLGWEQYQQRLHTWDTVKRTMRLDGHFYEGQEHLMFPPEWLDASESAWEQAALQARGPCWMGVDVAEGGRDLTAWVVVDRIGVVDVLVAKTPDTAAIPTTTVSLMERHGISSRRVCFDRGGGGKQLADQLKRQGRPVRTVAFGGSAKDHRTYQNRRAEMYGTLREAMRPTRWERAPVLDEHGRATGGEEWTRCMALPTEGDDLFHAELREELAMLPLGIGAEGKIFLPPKSRSTGARNLRQKTIEEIIGRSPDRADALALAVWARDGERTTIPRWEGPVAASFGEKKEPADEDALPAHGEDPEDREPTLADRLFGPEPPKRRPWLGEDFWR